MKTYTGWGFWSSVLHIEGLPIWLFYYRKPVSLVYPVSTQEHTIQICVTILQILIESELSWFWIAWIASFWYFCYFLCTLVWKKAQCAQSRLQNILWSTFTSNCEISKIHCAPYTCPETGLSMQKNFFFLWHGSQLSKQGRKTFEQLNRPWVASV